MKKSYLLLFSALFFLPCIGIYGQGLIDILESEEEETEYAYATFKTTRIVNGHSIEAAAPNDMIFIISHDFGPLSQGPYTLFGIDQASIRIGLEYTSPLPWLSVGAGRSSYQKTYDFFIKTRLLRQSKGKRNMPFSLVYFSSMDINTLKWQYPDRQNYFSSRLSYVHMLLIARKFSPGFSLQLTPTFVHRNFVKTRDEKNDVFAIGTGFRQKINNRISINGEYFYVFPGQLPTNFHNSLAIGLDIETGGHVFQLHFSNAQAMFERGFITESSGDFFRGDIFFGFNITRVFSL